MIWLITGIILLGAVAALIGYLRGEQAQEQHQEPEDQTVCCGQHATCERDSLLASVSKKIEYYDDEELDCYRGLPEDGYSEQAAEQFREVLYTLRETEVAGWLRSLQLRGIALPDALKEEALLIVTERRMN